MQLLLKRTTFTTNSTVGELSVDGRFECYTLEDVVRPFKIKGETAIPTGSYAVTIDLSNRFKRRLPLLKDVPDFVGVRIHTGNTKADTEGCILVGRTKLPDKVAESKLAFDALMPRMEAALAAGEPIRIDIVGQPPAATPQRGMARPAKKGAAKAAAQKAAAKAKTPAKAPAKKAPAKKTPTKKTPGKNAAASKAAPARKVAAKTVAAKTVAAKKAAARPTPARKAPATKVAARKVGAKKAGARKAVASPAAAKKAAPRRRAGG